MSASDFTGDSCIAYLIKADECYSDGQDVGNRDEFQLASDPLVDLFVANNGGLYYAKSHSIGAMIFDAKDRSVSELRIPDTSKIVVGKLNGDLRTETLQSLLGEWSERSSKEGIEGSFSSP